MEMSIHALAAEAALLRMELVVGLRDVPDVIKWADSKIAALPDCDEEIAELSMCWNDRPAALVILGRISSGADQFNALRTLCAKMHLIVLKDRDCFYWVVDSLLQFYLDFRRELPEDLFFIIAIDDGYELAFTGASEGCSMDSVIDSFLDYTKRFLPLLDSTWTCDESIVKAIAGARPISWNRRRAKIAPEKPRFWADVLTTLKCLCPYK